MFYNNTFNFFNTKKKIHLFIIKREKIFKLTKKLMQKFQIVFLKVMNQYPD